MQEWLGQDKFLSALPRPPSVSHAEEEQRTITQVCEMLLYEGVEAYKVEAYKKEGPKFVQCLVAKQKVRRPGQGPRGRCCDPAAKFALAQLDR
jgi:hypothetical protein